MPVFGEYPIELKLHLRWIMRIRKVGKQRLRKDEDVILFETYRFEISDFGLVLKPTAPESRRRMKYRRADIVSVQDIHVPVNRFNTAGNSAEIRAKVINNGLLHKCLILRANISILLSENQRGNESRLTTGSFCQTTLKYISYALYSDAKCEAMQQEGRSSRFIENKSD